jgi:hypothetical protein
MSALHKSLVTASECISLFLFFPNLVRTQQGKVYHCIKHTPKEQAECLAGRRLRIPVLVNTGAAHESITGELLDRGLGPAAERSEVGERSRVVVVRAVWTQIAKETIFNM